MLEPDPNDPGLWVTSGWKLGYPGTYAVIIGVSAYTHLEGGPGPRAAKTFDMGQLSVSALTAHAFFEWLVGRYAYQDSQPVWCRLLLAPQLRELEVEPHAVPPTLMNCKAALRSWHDALAALTDSAAANSRSLFFFSGHGLEVQSDRQILLPCDYLNPAVYGPNNALSTLNLAKGLKSLKVVQHFLFIDACRNDHNNLDEVDEITGDKILDEPKSRYYTKPPCYASVFYASAAGTQAWAPRDPRAGPSIFGRALLDGLVTGSCGSFDYADGLYRVSVHGLHRYLQSRVAEILHGRKDQYPVLAGNPLDPDAVVTEVSAPPGATGFEPKDANGIKTFPTIRVDLGNVCPASGKPADVHLLREAFGSEGLTAIWTKTVQLYNLTVPGWVDPQALVVHRVDRSEDGTSFQVELSLTGNRGNHWLAFDQHEKSAGRRAVVALLLPDNLPPGRFTALHRALPGWELIRLVPYPDANEVTRPRYILDLEWAEHLPGTMGIRRANLRLAPRQSDPHLESAADLWEKSDRADVRTALAEAAGRFRQYTDGSEFRSPLGAVLAGLLMLRAGRSDGLLDSLRGLTDVCDYLPDFPVLQAEVLLRYPEAGARGADEDRDDPLCHFLSLEQRGLPFTTGAFNLALKQADALGERDDLSGSDRERLEALHARLRRALRFFRNGGLFCTLVGPAVEVKPELARW